MANKPKPNMKKDEFQEVFNQVKMKMQKDFLIGGAFNDETKKKLGLNEMNIIPVNSIIRNVQTKGSYWINEKGYWRTYHKEGYKEHPYKNEAERIKVVKGLNEKIQRLRDKNEKERKRKLKNAQKEIAKERGTPLTEPQKNSIIFTTIKHPPPPDLIPLYDMYFSVKQIKYELHGFIIDNKPLFDICIKNGGSYFVVNETAKRWNKTVLEYYRTFTTDIYITLQRPFKEWFELNIEIVIDSKEYKAIPLLYDEQPEKKAGGESKKAKIQNVITKDHSKAKWADVILKFPSETSSIKGETKFGIKYKKENYEYFTFRELGLTKKNGEPTRDWIKFSMLLIPNPEMTEEDRDKINKINRDKIYRDKIKGSISRIRTFLKDFSGIEENPIFFDETHKRYNKQFRFIPPKEVEPTEYHDEIKY